jgi:hypothetical protein
MGNAGRERLRRHFSIDKMVGDTERLYREMVDDLARRTRDQT